MSVRIVCVGLLSSLLSSLLACSQSVDVLELEPPAPLSTPTQSGTAPPAASGDAGVGDAPDLPDQPAAPAGSEPGPSNEDGCGGCPARSLCSPRGCVDTSGPTVLEAGRLHTCLVNDGRLYCWGANGSGQLGTGDQGGRPEPARVGAANDWLAVSGGEAHSCGLRAPGALYCWGDNSKGQLGVGDTSKRLSPERVGPRDDWEEVACGGANCCALRDAGELHCWGDNLEGKPGQDDGYSEPDVLEPREVAGGFRYSAVALGQGHVNAISDAGLLIGWGRTPMGESGTGSVEGHLRVPTKLPVATGDGWVSVAAAQHHGCAVRGDGTLWCWGASPFGELGGSLMQEPMIVPVPAQVGDATDWASVAAGWFHTCATRQDGTLYCWGRAIEGQLGQGGGDPVPQPTPIAPDESWQQPVLGGFHSCALTEARALYCWGQNNVGQLGVPGEDRLLMPAQVAVP